MKLLKLSQKLALCLMLSVLNGQIANASSIAFSAAGDLTPMSTFNVAANDTFNIDIIGTGFTELFGGTLDFQYDPTVIQLNSLSVNDTLFAFIPSNGIEVTPGIRQGVGFDVDVFSDPAAAGDFVIASINFSALAQGVSPLNILPVGSQFFSSTAALTPAFENATINISEVPLPGSVWLMLTGLALIVRRKSTRHPH